MTHVKQGVREFGLCLTNLCSIIWLWALAYVLTHLKNKLRVHWWVSHPHNGARVSLPSSLFSITPKGRDGCTVTRKPWKLEKWPSHRRTKSCKSCTSAYVVEPQVTNQWCCMPRHVNVPPRSSKTHVVLAMWCFFPATIFSSLFFNAVHFYFHPIFIQSHPSLLLTHAFPWPCPFFSYLIHLIRAIITFTIAHHCTRDFVSSLN